MTRVRGSSAAQLCAVLASNAARGHSYPAKPVRLMVGFATGDGTDSLARVIARKLAKIWPQRIVAENRARAKSSKAARLRFKIEASFIAFFRREIGRKSSLIVRILAMAHFWR
jgi:hypothetical protein